MTKPTKPSFEFREWNGTIQVHEDGKWRLATREEERQVREWNVQQAAEDGAK